MGGGGRGTEIDHVLVKSYYLRNELCMNLCFRRGNVSIEKKRQWFNPTLMSVNGCPLRYDTTVSFDGRFTLKAVQQMWVNLSFTRISLWLLIWLWKPHFITASKRSCGKVMFLLLSVSHSVHRRVFGPGSGGCVCLWVRGKEGCGRHSQVDTS